MREIININREWLFSKNSDFSESENINIPHSYNGIDGQDGNNDYYRGKAWYQKNFSCQLNDDEELWLEVNGASMTCEVWLNGSKLNYHEGGYSTFRTNLTEQLKDENTLLLVVDNSYSEHYYPQKADFTFYGGVYRDVNLIRVNKKHFELGYYGSRGIQITPEVSEDLKSCRVTVEMYANGETADVTLNGQTRRAIFRNGKARAVFEIDNPYLWDGLKDPYLYEARAVLDSGDEITQKFGCRRFEIDPEKGFILNNREYRLVGVSKHQDRPVKAYAVSKEDLEEDMALIRETGVTSLRLAHYQHDQYFYDLCDKYGLLVWAEIPYITAHMKEGRENTISQMKELIIQNYNHPSIYCWGLSNEITTHGGVTDDLMENHKILNDLVHELDKTRVSTMAHVFLLKTKEKLVRLPDVCAYNLYYGWYVGDLDQNDKFFDTYHKKYPKSCVGLSEFGADANVQYQTVNPVKGDYSEAYQCLYHEHILKMWETRKFIWCVYAWNMFDFGAEGRHEGGKAGQNQKGLVTFDRKLRKDAFYLYKAYFSEEPFVHLCGRRYVERTEEETLIKVYSNQPEITLLVDGNLVETRKGSRIFEFRVKISGRHHIEARANDLHDEMDIEKVNEKNPAYESDTMKIHNWFDAEVKKGYFSLKDSAFRIKRNKEGKKVLDEYFYPMINGISTKYGDVSSGFKVPKIVYTLMELVPLETLFKFMGSMATLEGVEGLAQHLPEIKK